MSNKATLDDLRRIKEELRIVQANAASAFSAVEHLIVRLADEDERAAQTAPPPAQPFGPPRPRKTPIGAAKVEVVQAKEELTINDEWKAVLSAFDAPGNQFLTGGAGTGKSTLLGHFLAGYDGNAAVVAPTGVAALRVGGETIHRFFKFGIGAMHPEEVRELEDDRRAKYRALDMLIVDEASMIRADLMDQMDVFMRKNGRDEGLPFGGCKVVLVGDLYQLPPVTKDIAEKRWLKQRYGSETPYFFHAECWRNTPLKVFELTTVFRQKDPQFTSVLNAARKGSLSTEQLSFINAHYVPNFVAPGSEPWITLTTTNASVDAANRRMMAGLGGPSRTFDARLDGEFKDLPTDEHLELKVGAAVMCIRNDSERRWMNGTLARVIKLDPLTIDVGGAHYEMIPETWEQIAYDLDDKTQKLTRKIVGRFEQIPLRLAAASTIHKSQGLSLDRAILDFAGGAFAAGQGYVALSRLRTADGLILRTRMRMEDLIISNEVRAFTTGQPIARPGLML